MPPHVLRVHLAIQGHHNRINGQLLRQWQRLTPEPALRLSTQNTEAQLQTGRQVPEVLIPCSKERHVLWHKNTSCQASYAALA